MSSCAYEDVFANVLLQESRNLSRSIVGVNTAVLGRDLLNL